MRVNDFEIDIAINVYEVETGKWIVKYNSIALSDKTVQSIMEDVEEALQQELEPSDDKRFDNMDGVIYDND
jgi:hypothetical protein